MSLDNPPFLFHVSNSCISDWRRSSKATFEGVYCTCIVTSHWSESRLGKGLSWPWLMRNADGSEDALSATTDIPFGYRFCLKNSVMRLKRRIAFDSDSQYFLTSPPSESAMISICSLVNLYPSG
jgi:hypothetical protein